MDSGFLARNHKHSAVRLQPLGTWNGHAGSPPIGPGVDALVATTGDTVFHPARLLLELGANVPLADAQDRAVAAADDVIRAVEKRLAAAVERSPEHAAVLTARATRTAAADALTAAHTELERAKAAYREGIRKSPDVQLRANLEFREARVEDATADDARASAALTTAERQLVAVRGRVRAKLLADARAELERQRAGLVEEAAAFAAKLGAEVLALDAVGRAIDAAAKE